MKRILLKHGEEDRIHMGHPWVYDNEAGAVLSGPGDSPPAVLVPGETADVESDRKEYLGRALVNPASKIIARIYSPSKEGIDKGFFKRRLREAVVRRIDAGYDLRRESARLVFAEADFLPGLIVDRFVGWPLKDIESAVVPRPLSFDPASAALGPPRSWLSVQFLVCGMDSRREEILDALTDVLGQDGFIMPGGVPLGEGAGIVEKSTAKVRELEGLPLREGLIRGGFPTGGIVIFENGLPFMLNLLEGQKTGHFLDQKDNRLRFGDFARETSLRSAGRVLDAFSYTGGFGIHAARSGAAEVVCVDLSAAALETARINAALNGVGDRVTVVEADVFEYLRSCERRKETFDLIVLDPPSFAKSKSALEGALRGYKDINLNALKLLNPRGVLVSCSCSQAVDQDRFRRMIAGAAADAGRRLVQLDFRGQGADHPVLVGYDESLYLTCAFYRA
jgi:23S rRNA (cytosine1962-C5)-methyltransferase